MKKNRPAIQLTALCENADVPKLADIIFAETTSFGIRMDQVSRLKLDRKFETVKTEYGEITVKLGLKDGKIIQVAPEYESVRVASEKTGASLRAVYQAAQTTLTKIRPPRHVPRGKSAGLDRGRPFRDRKNFHAVRQIRAKPFSAAWRPALTICRWNILTGSSIAVFPRAASANCCAWCIR